MLKDFSVVNVKSCIAGLSKIFASFNFSKFTAEDFRLAKFNDNRSYRTLLRLVYEIIYFDNYKCVDEICEEGFKRFKLTDVHNYIYNQLLKLDYPGLFTQFDENFTPRKLLIAASWLIMHCKIITKLENINLIDVIKTTFELSNENSNVFQECEINKNCNREKISDSSSMDWMLWLTGRLRLQLKQLYQVRLEMINTSLKHHNDKTSKLPPVERWVVNNTEALCKRIQNYEFLSTQLELFIFWRTTSHVFWQWMNSVLVEDESTTKDYLIREEAHISFHSRVLSEIHKSLNEALHKYSFIANNLSLNLSLASVEETSPNIDESLVKLLMSIDSDIYYFVEQMNDIDSCENAMLKPFNFNYFIANDAMKNNLTRSKTTHYDFDLSEECAKLASIVLNVRVQCETIKSKMKEKLQSVGSELLPDALCIY